MTLGRTWKLIYAEGDDIATAKAIHQEVLKRFGGKVARGSTVHWKPMEDSPELFSAITDCGWNWLELYAWQFGRPGVHRYISSIEDWDEHTLLWITADAETISSA